MLLILVGTLPAFQRDRQVEKLTLSQPNRQSKLEMFQQEVEELFFLQTGAFIVTPWWEVIAGVPSNPEAKL